MSQSLSRKSLDSLPDRVSKPQYQFNTIHPGIIHLGLGNFHRAHQALYLDDLFNMDLDHDWGIVGSGVMPHDAAMRKALFEQDLLTTVVELEPGANRVRVIGSMVDFLQV
jgi:mannitol 2-dehydrogenase